MTVIAGAFPYDIDNLLGGAVRILYAPTSVAIPANIADVISMVSPYAPQTGWLDVGATKESFSSSRGFSTEGFEIQQTTGNVIEEITGLTRAIQVSFAEFRPTILQIIEANVGGVDTIAAAAHKGAQKRVTFGSIKSVDQYRWAFISRRAKASGLVVETETSVSRGRFVMGTMYRGQVAADDASIEQGKGNLSAAQVSFNGFPDDTQAEGEEYGAWFMEDAGTIAAS
jgi:hypothetical protein